MEKEELVIDTTKGAEEIVAKLSKDVILISFRYGILPFSWFVLENPDQRGRELVSRCYSLFEDVKKYYNEKIINKEKKLVEEKDAVEEEEKTIPN